MKRVIHFLPAASIPSTLMACLRDDVAAGHEVSLRRPVGWKACVAASQQQPLELAPRALGREST